MAVTYKAVEDAYKKKNEAVDQATAAENAAYAAQRGDIAANAGSTLQQLYLQKNREERLQEQRNKAAGITGGAAESSRMALEANYSINRTNAMLERDRQLSQVNIAQNQTAAQAEIQKKANDVELATGQLSFDQDQQSLKRSEAWELVRAGSITPAVRAMLPEWDEAALRAVYERYKKEEE